MPIKKILIPLVLFCTSIFADITMQQKFAHAHEGDFVVTAQESNYSLLFIRSITADTLLLEEISAPERQIDLKKIDWKEWATQKAPGHTSWTLFEIDRKTGKLVECFSFSRNGWLYVEESEQFLARLMSLPLHAVPIAERRKVGAATDVENDDHRPVWNPPLVVEGKKIPKAAFDVMKAQWPDDGSRLKLCTIELYFAQEDPTFPFPYWLEVHSPHYTFKMRAVDSGHALISPMTGSMPHRSPHILGTTQKGKDQWELNISTPPYFHKLNLYVIDLTGESKAAIPIPFRFLPLQREEAVLEISPKDLQKVLHDQHRYRWVIVPEGSADSYVESEEIFTYRQE